MKNTGSALWFVPEELKTPELCLVAVKTGASLYYVPDNSRTQEIYLAAIQNGGFDRVPEENRTKEIYLAAYDYFKGKNFPSHMRFDSEHLFKQFFPEE